MCNSSLQKLKKDSITLGEYSFIYLFFYGTSKSVTIYSYHLRVFIFNLSSIYFIIRGKFELNKKKELYVYLSLKQVKLQIFTFCLNKN